MFQVFFSMTGPSQPYPGPPQAPVPPQVPGFVNQPQNIMGKLKVLRGVFLVMLHYQKFILWNAPTTCICPITNLQGFEIELY